MACGKSLIAAFLVAVTLSSMSSSPEARNLFQTTGEWSTPDASRGRSQIEKLGPQPNMYYPDYTPITRTPIPGYTPLPIAPLPDYPPHKNGLSPIEKLGPQPNMYSYNPNSYFPSPFPTPPGYQPFPIPGLFNHPLQHNPTKMASVPTAVMVVPFPPDTPIPGPF